MRRSEVEVDEQAANISETPWAYVSTIYDSPRGLESGESSSIFSIFCCCLSNKNNCRSQSDISINFTTENPSVILSQALLCLDNPQVPSGQVSFPITEEFILANHRCQNVLQQPCVTKSTQMLFMGYDVAFLQEIQVPKDLSSSETTPRIVDDTEED